MGAELGFVFHGGAAEDTVAEVKVFEAAVARGGDLAKDAGDAEGEVLVIGVEEKINGAQGFRGFVHVPDSDKFLAVEVTELASARMGETELHFVFGGSDGAFRPGTLCFPHGVPAGVQIQALFVRTRRPYFKMDVTGFLKRATLAPGRRERLDGHT